MKALVLAGGFGTRLRPLTYTRPKHLLPVANRAHIDHVFDLLLRAEVFEAVLLTSYLAESFGDTVRAAGKRGLRVEVAHEPEALGTAGALKNAEPSLGSDTFVVFNGDILTESNLRALLRFHRERQAEATILLTPVEDPSAFGVVPTAGDGRVLGFIEKPPPGEAPTNLINAGIYVMEPSVLKRVPAGAVWSAERQLFPGLVEDGAALYALATAEYWIDIGTPGTYLAANMDALAGRFRSSHVPPPGPDRVLAAPGSVVAEGARVSSSCLGDGAVIGDGAAVERSVLLPNAVVEAGAVVQDSILGDGARVASGVKVSAQTVADGEVVVRDKGAGGGT